MVAFVVDAWFGHYVLCWFDDTHGDSSYREKSLVILSNKMTLEKLMPLKSLIAFKPTEEKEQIYLFLFS